MNLETKFSLYWNHFSSKKWNNFIKINGFLKEFKFHSKRKWRFDAAWPEKMIAVEFEGGIWTNGRHTRGKGYENDCEKYNNALLLGWRVFRLTPGLCTLENVEMIFKYIHDIS